MVLRGIARSSDRHMNCAGGLPLWAAKLQEPIAGCAGGRVAPRTKTAMKVSDAPFDRVAPYLTTGLDVLIGAEGVVIGVGADCVDVCGLPS